MKRRAFLKTIGYGAVTNLAACPTPIHRYSKDTVVEKVLLIGVDGLRPDALQEATTPHIDKLWKDGAYNFVARTGEYTVSGPGWSNILTGVWENKHKVIDNTFLGANYQEYPPFFTRVEDSRPVLNTYSIASLDWFSELINTRVDQRIYHPFKDKGDLQVAKTTANLLSSYDVDVMFSYFMGVDEAGHSHGFSPTVRGYRQEIEVIDAYVGMMVEALKRRPRYERENWLTILISDHGGKGKSHGGVGEEAKRIPFIMHGPSVKPGEIFPVPTQVDVVPAILTHLGIPVKPEWSLDGKVVGLKEIDIRRGA